MKFAWKLLAAAAALSLGMAAQAAPIVIKYSHVVADVTPKAASLPWLTKGVALVVTK